ncbi:tripartite tricarboxylate transporter TctB family protein [Nocardioides luteus]|uniref:tripartite tricarboxylate transporter TctB family protein n=1 Tax=Nocardioides luteus TaxID=1844 RepID=UPI0018CBE8A4|nr:tripartite tricarboxylate transporter TctB family protein [Nocardioides luteus]MBG6099416.1 putative tricarboxylic transport membrane protein [Nocardioides luteus]
MSDNTNIPASTAAGGPATADERRRSVLPLVVAALVVAIGAAAFIGSRSLGYWDDLGPGPGFFPLWLGVLLVALGLVWFGQELRARLRPETPENPNRPAVDEEETPDYSLPTVLAILVSLCVLAACLELVGYQVSMLVFLLFHLLVVGRRGPLQSLVIAVIGSFGVFYAFTRLLTVPLPVSSIPFLRDLGL